MAIAFPRSIRALGNDRFRPSLATLLVTSFLLLAWFVWFFFAPIPQFESGTNVKPGRNGIVLVTFPAAVHARLRAGQPAVLQIDVPGQTSATYQGQVMRVQDTAPTAQLYFAELAVVSPDAQAAARVEIESTTPASLLLQAIRQSSASLNPSPVPTVAATPTP